MTFWQLDKTQQMCYGACKEQSLWSHDTVNINTGHGPVSKDFPRGLPNFCSWFVMWCNIPQALIWTGPNDMHFLFFEVWNDSNEITMWSQNSEAKHHSLKPTCYQNQIQICHFPVTSSWNPKFRPKKKVDFLQFLDMRTCGLFPHSGFNHDLKTDMSSFYSLGCW